MDNRGDGYAIVLTLMLVLVGFSLFFYQETTNNYARWVRRTQQAIDLSTRAALNALEPNNVELGFLINTASSSNSAFLDIYSSNYNNYFVLDKVTAHSNFISTFASNMGMAVADVQPYIHTLILEVEPVSEHFLSYTLTVDNMSSYNGTSLNSIRTQMVSSLGTSSYITKVFSNSVESIVNLDKRTYFIGVVDELPVPHMSAETISTHYISSSNLQRQLQRRQ